MANFKINDKSEKTTIVGADLSIIGDSEDLLLTDYKLKKLTMTNLLSYIQNNISFPASPTIKYLTSTDSPFTITDGDGYGKFICDTSGGNITINLPTLADNPNRELQFIHQTGGNLLTIDGESSETIDGLTSIELPKQYDRMTILGTTAEWGMLEERISCQLRLDTYAGYGSTDNKIMQFTNSREDYGNIFSHNHGSYGTAGLEITINKTGKYCFAFVYDASAGQGYYGGLSKDSAQLTTVIQSITVSDRLMMAHDTNVGSSIPIPWSGVLEKNSVIRPHTNGSIPDAPSYCHITVTYEGN